MSRLDIWNDGSTFKIKLMKTNENYSIDTTRLWLIQYIDIFLLNNRDKIIWIVLMSAVGAFNWSSGDESIVCPNTIVLRKRNQRINQLFMKQSNYIRVQIRLTWVWLSWCIVRVCKLQKDKSVSGTYLHWEGLLTLVVDYCGVCYDSSYRHKGHQDEKLQVLQYRDEM